MKKATAIFIATVMLVSMVPGAFAANHVVSEYLLYYLDMSGKVSSWPTNSFQTHYSDTFSGFRVFPGPTADPAAATGVIAAPGTAMGKSESNQVMQMAIGAHVANNRVDVSGSLNPDDNTGNGTFTGYAAGEKVHMSAQYYIPRAQSYYSEATKGPRMALTLYEGNTTATFVPSTATVTGTGALLTFAPTSVDGGKFYFLGVLEAAETWSAETCYTVDAVVTFGEIPTLSVYVNGNPLAFENTTADGTAITSENVKLSKPSYGIAANAMCAMTSVYDPEGMTCIYTDEWIFENLRAGDEPELYNPVSFEGIKAGDAIVIDNGAEVTVNVDLTDCSEVALYVNGEKLDTLTAPPYTFVIPPDVTPGTAALRAVAKAGTASYESDLSVALVTSYYRSAMDEDFEAYENTQKSLDGGWYSPSSRFYGTKLVENGWFIKPMTVTDKAKRDFDKSFVLGCDAGAGESWINVNGETQTDLKYGFQRFNGTDNTVISGNKAVLDWQMYVDNTNMETFAMYTAQKLFDWRPSEQKLKWNVKGDAVYTDPKLGYWQNYVLTIDMTAPATKLSLSIDGEPIFENLEASAAISSFNNVTWHLIPDLEKGCRIGLDEVKLTHLIPRPSFGAASFYRGESRYTDLERISADTDAIAIAVDGGLLTNNLEQNVEFLENGKTLTFVNDAGETVKTELLLADGTLWLVPPRPLLSNTEYTVILKKTALFADYAAIGYDQNFTFQTKSSDSDVVGMEYFKNGIKMEDLTAAAFTAGDQIKASITLCNQTETDQQVYIMLLGYNDMLLSAVAVIPVTVTAGATAQTVETPEITVADGNGFSAAVTVCNSDFLPIADALNVSGNQ